jgi:hypothetical protein
MGIYTSTGATLSLLNSGSAAVAVAANANNSDLLVGQRFWTIDSTAWSSNPIFRFGSQYYVGWFWSSAGQVGQTGSVLGAYRFSTVQRSGSFGVSQTTNTSMGYEPFYGIYTATTAAFPASIANSQLNKVSANAGFIPHVAFVGHTAISRF